MGDAPAIGVLVPVDPGPPPLPPEARPIGRAALVLARARLYELHVESSSTKHALSLEDRPIE